jgi:FkbM family methyltransferase
LPRGSGAPWSGSADSETAERQKDMKILTELTKLPAYIRAFGPGGASLWAGIQRKQSPLSLPGFPGPVYLRYDRGTDQSIFWQVLVRREYDISGLPQNRTVAARYREIRDSGRKPVIIDCGGFTGLSAMWFASQYPQAQIIAVEPDSGNFEMLRRNAEAYPQITPVHGGIWDRSGYISITNPNAGSASFRCEEAEAGTRAYTIPELLESLAPAQPLFIVKIDIEGGEAALFRSPAPWLGEAAMVAIELHDWLYPGQQTSRNFMRQLAANPFEVLLKGENLCCIAAGRRDADPDNEPSRKND